MKRKMGLVLALLLALVALIAVTGCRWVKFPTFDETKTVSVSGSTKLIADIEQGVGELTLRSPVGSAPEVNADFVFAPEAWRPEVSSSVEGSSTRVRIVQPTSSNFNPFAYTRNTWVVSLPAAIPTDLTLKMGAGNADVDLHGVDLVALSVEMGAGNLTLDLTGLRTTDLTARVKFGVGNVTVRLPRSVGIRVVFEEKGVGNMTFDGLRSQGDTYVNDLYAGTGPKIDIVVSRGAGNVTFALVD
jgi:hypothetical protein